MALKLVRCFFGGYQPDYLILKQRGYKIIPKPRRLITVLNVDQGFGQIKGLTTEKENNGTVVFPNAQICLFKKSTRQLLWETTSKANGSYSFRNVAVGLECFVVAFDPSREYNAVIQDAVVAK